MSDVKLVSSSDVLQISLWSIQNNCVIVEYTDEKDEEHAIFYEGSCNSWLHCEYASLSSSTFQHLSDSNTCVFITFYQIKLFKWLNWNQHLAQLTSKLSNDSSHLPASPNASTNLPDDTAAVPTKSLNLDGLFRKEI